MLNRKPIFDTVREMLGRGFTQDDVDRLDDAIDLAESALTAEAGPAPDFEGDRTIGDAGLELIKSFEGCYKPIGNGKFTAYPDPGSRNGEPWTIGWGSTGSDISKGTVWTQEQCDERFATDISKYVDAVARELGDVPTTQNQFDALVSFHYNTGAIHRATLTRKHKDGDFGGTEREFLRWVYNDGQMLRGLKRRREAEAKLYATGS
ncbi:lysozyme [Novosphingobium mangrovi (ex Hu et al. 2023)]|uniref:Lysozyme n=1 Tax=Novosphingobium mangrovi (ex Hu et al. 2023) TaxID=2930094 RepID=A0ABT0AII9_9SPHN|nr:lysozyme [Novosphingobium mangrovi (ex Hu et al. 2023)]MCJ1962985.1 lysozyme [Novosphingobium mangrovi (ex Hu et al. 2023)]